MIFPTDVWLPDSATPSLTAPREQMPSADSSTEARQLVGSVSAKRAKHARTHPQHTARNPVVDFAPRVKLLQG